MKKHFETLFLEVLAMAEKYELNTNKISKTIEEIPQFMVTTPIVGGFSTGKSSLVNAVLGEKILAVNITPETALPTEITYGNDTVTTIKQDGGTQTMPLQEFCPDVLATDKYSLVKIQTSNAFFSQIPSIRLVDMPGFDSGIEVHNRAIDDYLPKSLAYILAVSADEGTLRESIIRFLNEMKLYQVPIYTVITKSKRVTTEQLEQMKKHITETIQHFFDVELVKLAVTESKKEPISIEEFKNFLLELQEKSEDIFNQVFTQHLQESCIAIEQYLAERLKQTDFTTEDIRMEKEQLEQEVSVLAQQFEQEKERFTEQIEKCISAIQKKIVRDLNSSKEMIVSLLLQNSDVTEKINTLVRNAVAIGVQTELEPRINKYLRNITETIQITTFGNANVELSEARLASDKKLEAALNSATTPVITVISTAIGGILGGPVGATIGAALGALASAFIGDGISKKQEAERRQLAQQKAEELIESVCTDAGNEVATEIMTYVDGLNEELEQEIQSQMERKEKALADTELKLQLSIQEKEQEIIMLQTDLLQIRGIKDGR